MEQDSSKLQRRLEGLMTVQDIAQELMSELDSFQLLTKILDAAVRVLNADTGSLLLWAPPDALEWAVSADVQLVGQRMPADQGIAGWAFTHEEAVMVSNAREDSRFFHEIAPNFRTDSLIAVPLMTPTERIGVIEVLNKRSGEQFDEQDRDVLTALSAQAATAIVNARLYQELREEKNRILDVEGQLHKKLARELHDGPAQTLASMIMDVEFILMLYEREPAKVPEELQRLRQAASKTLAQVRNTMFELRPVILETQGLNAALNSYVERLVSTEDMHINLDIRNLEDRLPSQIEQLCFDIVQEAVGNVKKHANAEHTWIVIERRPKSLVVAVRDDGQGFDVERIEQAYDRSGRMGLLNIRERCEVMGARYSIESVPGKGTLVSLIVPLPDVAPPEQTQPPPPATPEAALSYQRAMMRRRKGTGPLDLFGKNRQGENGQPT